MAEPGMLIAPAPPPARGRCRTELDEGHEPAGTHIPPPNPRGDPEMNIKSKAVVGAVLVACGLASTSVLFAASVTNTMPVKITIQNACNVATTAPTTLDFG